MAFDGIIACAMANELNEHLAKGKIEKIYQPEPDELLFHIHTKKGSVKLFMSCNSSHARIHMIENAPENPASPTSLCMLLRKHLQGGRIVTVTQKDTERIIEILLETTDELGFSVNKKLIVEIMGKHSNIILVNSKENKIIDSIKRISIDVNRARQILPGMGYVYPPTQNKIPFSLITKEDFEKICVGDEDQKAAAILSGIQGISPAAAVTLATQSDPWESFCAIKQLTSFPVSTASVYVKENGEPVDFHILPLSSCQGIYEKLDFPDLSSAVDYYFINKASSNRIKQKTTVLIKSVKTHLDKACLKKQKLGEDLLKAQNSDKYRLYGELITAGLHKIKTGDTQAILTNYYNGEEVTVPLDKRYAPAKNAQMYFKKYSKAKTAVKEKKIQLDETDKEIRYLESVISFAEQASSPDEVDLLREELSEGGYIRKRKSQKNKKATKAKPYSYVLSSGLKVMAGRNNTGNDQLTMKSASGKDMWFHTKDIPGSHVIVFSGGNELSEKDIFEAASIAAYHSKGRDSENVPVDYTLVKYVKKPSGAKPGMVIFTHNKTVYVTPQIPLSSR